jgi:hypothetical protein
VPLTTLIENAEAAGRLARRRGTSLDQARSRISGWERSAVKQQTRYRLLIWFFLGSTFGLGMWAVHGLTRSALVPWPIRTYESHSNSFADLARFLRSRHQAGEGNNVRPELSRLVYPPGVKSASVDGEYILFTFESLPPDAIDQIGCVLREGADPSGILWDFPRKNPSMTVFHFQRLGGGWFYVLGFRPLNGYHWISISPSEEQPHATALRAADPQHQSRLYPH